MVEALDVMTDNWERREFLRSVNAAYEELRRNKEMWEEELDERRLWDATLADGLDDD